MPSIARPQKVYDFTAHARRQPTAPPPGDRIDAQLQNHADAIAATQLAVERLVAAQTRPTDVEAPARAIIAQAERAAQEIRRTAGDAAAIVDQAKFELGRIWDQARRAVDVADRAEARLAAAVLDAQSSPAPAPNFYPGQAMPSLGYGAGGPYAGDDAGAAAVSADYAQVAIEWAEHMPDTIPPNILAVNAISGDHWSSRWWANRSANAFGMLAWWYMGAWPDPGPPSTPNDPTGQPLPAGAVYFNTTHNQMMVWNGSAWVGAAFSPAKNITASLYYHATAGQTVFPLTTPDIYGQSFAFSTVAPESVEVFVAGERVERGLYALNVATSTVTFTTGITPAGTSVIFDVLAPASEFAAGICLVNDIVPNGSTTLFHLTARVDGRAVNTSRSEELWVSVDGVLQKPVDDYTASGDAVTFSTAPAADSKVIIVWFGPVASGRAGTPSDLLPLADGVAAPGTSLLYARGDHVHPAGGGGGIADAPNDGTAYARKSVAWSHLSHLDITDWTAATSALGAVVQATPPASPSVGMLWWDSTGGQMYIRYDDGDTQQWVAVVNEVGAYLSLAGGSVQGAIDLKAQAVTQSGASLAINRSIAENCFLSLIANVTSVAITGWPALGFTGKARLIVTNAGAFTIGGWPAGTIWPGGIAPTVTSGAGKKDIFLLMSDDGGTTIYGSVVGQDYR